MAARRSGLSGCCASISCSSGSICRTRRWRRHFTIRRQCGALSTSTSAASRHPTKPRCAASVICSHQTKKGNQWYFGMKALFGIASRTKLIHAVVATPANVADSPLLPELLHGEETRVWGDQAYRGQRAVIREHAPKARDFTNRRYRHRGVVDEVERVNNRTH